MFKAVLQAVCFLTSALEIMSGTVLGDVLSWGGFGMLGSATRVLARALQVSWALDWSRTLRWMRSLSLWVSYTQLLSVEHNFAVMSHIWDSENKEKSP